MVLLEKWWFLVRSIVSYHRRHGQCKCCIAVVISNVANNITKHQLLQGNTTLIWGCEGIRLALNPKWTRQDSGSTPDISTKIQVISEKRMGERND